MTKIKEYWYKDRSVPFGTLLNLVDAYCNPEAYDGAYEALVQRARSSKPEDSDIRIFKAELTQLLQGDRDGLHPHALGTAAEYDDYDDTAFLARLWHDLYPDEPVPEAS
ncbi:hypothetical protein OG394_21535 [Kribbella sp. NBC_01245]|uniref:hypothetical protein n=1 Tax=Kribbella sp. NBC_01245 TaxID=2903578 RepID=UPI002E2A7B68|nr:hypothetical protein [Kribbella sp. NBC_01245]